MSRSPLNLEQSRRAAMKIIDLRKTGVPEEQATIAAMRMARTDRLDETGTYVAIPGK